MTHSLKWRIAAWYALLLLAVIVAVSVAISLRFQQILYAQAQAHLTATMQDIESAVLPPASAFMIVNPDPLQALESSDNLQHWASTTTYLQVDDTSGHTLAKSFNLGTAGFPPAPELTPQKPGNVRTVNVGNTPFLVESRLFSAGNEAAIVQIGEPLDQLNRAFAETRQTILIILFVAVLAVVILSLALAAQATNPIDQLARAMREIGSDRLNRRVRWKDRRDEIGRLAETFDDLMARLEESFARERQFISDASHELRTPLTSINSNAQLLSRWGDRDERIRHESLETIAKESASLAGMVSGMLTLAKADSGEAIPREPVPVANIGAAAVAAAQSRASEKHLKLRYETDGKPAIVHGDSMLIGQVFSNLIDNAIKFTDSGEVAVRVTSDDQTAIIEVRDTGPGIEPHELPFVFDRFYRTDKSRSRSLPGTGLGLAIVRSIARVHAGRVEAEPAAGGGTLFRVRLPLLSDSHGAPVPSP